MRVLLLLEFLELLKLLSQLLVIRNSGRDVCTLVFLSEGAMILRMT